MVSSVSQHEFRLVILYVANLLKTVVDGEKQYEARKLDVDAAIRNYDQTVIHLTARIVAGRALFLPYLMKNNGINESRL
jgi:hypothetical protein